MCVCHAGMLDALAEGQLWLWGRLCLLGVELYAVDATASLCPMCFIQDLVEKMVWVRIRLAFHRYPAKVMDGIAVGRANP